MFVKPKLSFAFTNADERGRESPEGSERLPKRYRLSPMHRAKGELSRVSEPSQQLPPKRRRLDGKHEVNNVAQEWNQIIASCHRILPRVGFRVIEDDTILRRKI